jgi:hypothetical protein
MLVGTTLALLLHAIPRPSVLSSFLPYTILTSQNSVYCCLALALGAQPLDSRTIYLVYINRDCLCHLWDQRGQAKLTQEPGSQQLRARSSTPWKIRKIKRALPWR